MSEQQEGYSVPAIREAPVPMLAVSLEEARAQVHAVQQFIKSLMVEGVDYGTIPGTPKPTLYQPGAHKLINIYALDVTTELLDSTEDWDKPFFAYRYRTALRYRGRVVGTCEGSCNSMEARYRWRWVPEHKLPAGMDKATLESRGGKLSEFDFAVEKAETSGKYGKPEAYWQRFKGAIESGEAQKVQRKTKAGKSYPAWEIDGTSYRIPNDDIFSLVNTLQKMGQKRSVVGATLMATRTGDIFTQDIEDMNIVEGDYRDVPLKPRGDEEESNGATNGDPPRPWKPDVLKKKMCIAVSKKPGATTKPSQGQTGLLAGKLEEAWPGDKGAADNRHEVLGWLTGHRSAKDLSLAWTNTLLNWLLANDGETFNEHSREEARLVYKRAMLDQGQQELPTGDDIAKDLADTFGNVEGRDE